MAIDFDELFYTLESSLKKGGGVSQNMKALLDFAQTEAPDSQWQDLQQLDYNADIPVVRDWLTSLISTQPPGEKIVGLWFGTEEIWKGNTREGYGLFVVGSEDFDEKDSEWACEASYEPAPRNVKCDAMDKAQAIIEKTKDGSISNNGEYIAILGYAALLVQECLRLMTGEPQFQHLVGKNVVVGFSGGDFLNLGKVSASVKAV